MSENYPSDVKLNENPDGTVSFATEVIATIAGLAATEVDGVASMSSPSSGFADMFSRKNTRNFTKGVRIDLEGSKVAVDITIVVDYGSPVPDVARNIQENVKKAIETMSGLDVRNVDVHVSAISFEREQRANAELDEQHRKMLERSAEASAAKAADPEPVPPKPEEKKAAPEPVAEPEPEPVAEAEPEPEVEPEDEPEPEVEEVIVEPVVEAEEEEEEQAVEPQPEPEPEPEPVEDFVAPAKPEEEDIEDYVEVYEDYEEASEDDASAADGDDEDALE